MAWFKVDDGFWSHPKVIDLPLLAVGVWARAGSYVADKMTDGFVPSGLIGMICTTEDEYDRVHDAIEHLVRRGLWDVVDGGWLFHDWHHFQPSRADLESKRAADRDRKARKAQEQHRKGGKFHADSVRNPDGIRSASTAPEPEPEPEPRSSKPFIDASVDGASDAASFDEFWSIYPRREGKQAARKAWAKVTKAVSADVVIAGAIRYRDDPNRDPQFTKHPTTWLNAGCWDDEPLPPRTGGQGPDLLGQYQRGLAEIAQMRIATEPTATVTRLEITS